MQVDTDADPNAHNDNVTIHNNEILANGGTNLAGAIGIFRGTDNYRINDNLICGNMSAEYGGGISHFGYSPGGVIDHNKVMLNYAVDEGGGVQISGEPPINLNTSTPDPTRLSMGAGSVSIHDNFLGDNLGYDDGGGLHFLEAGVAPMSVYNNMVNDNASADDGGGISLDDAPNVQVVNDTVANNITTATAATSSGNPAPAGLSSVQNSTQLSDFVNCWNGTNNGQSYGGRSLTVAQQSALGTLCGNFSVFNVAITGGPSGGTFTLSFGGHTTAPISRNATAGTVQGALRALPGLAGAVVSGPRRGPYTVTVPGAVGPLTGNGAGLTPHGIVSVVQLVFLQPFTTQVDTGFATQTTEDVLPQVYNVTCPQYLSWERTHTFPFAVSAADQTACQNMANVPYSRPALVNDLLWGNLAGTWDPIHSTSSISGAGTVVGIGLPQSMVNSPACPFPAAPCAWPAWDPQVNHWDIGVVDGSDAAIKLAPVHSLLDSSQGYAPNPSNTVVPPGAGLPDPGTGDPLPGPNFLGAYLVHVQADPYRLQPRFRPSTLITLNLPPNVLGDYHIESTSGAVDRGLHSCPRLPGCLHRHRAELRHLRQPAARRQRVDAGCRCPSAHCRRWWR